MPERERVDGTKGFDIKIGTRQIKKGKRRDPRDCIIAKAILKAWGKKAQAAEVGHTRILVMTKTQIIRYKTPWAFSRAIIIFDTFPGVWTLIPGTYHISPMSPAHRVKERARRNKKPKKRKPTKQSSLFRNKVIKSRKTMRWDKLVMGV